MSSGRRKPKLLDLFCGAGGATRGYQQAGFHVTGVDLVESPNYVGDDFHQADAMTFPLNGFDAIHASPPCQHYAAVTRWRGRAEDHPDLLGPTFDRLSSQSAPWVVENVPSKDIPYEPHIVLCGSRFGLPIRRHRWFWTSWLTFAMAPSCQHRPTDLAFDHGGTGATESEYREAMGVEWMTVKESRNAIPPAYTEHIGTRLRARLEVAA